MGLYSSQYIYIYIWKKTNNHVPNHQPVMIVQHITTRYDAAVQFEVRLLTPVPQLDRFSASIPSLLGDSAPGQGTQFPFRLRGYTT